MQERLSGAGREVSRDTLITIDHANIVANSTLVGTTTASDEAGLPTLAALGLQLNDIIDGINPVNALPPGIGIVGARVSAAGTIAVTLANVTVAAIDPAAIQYRVVWRRTGL